uniref:Uncharacterized protein n=1 Tax=viral metagenome TaxID=1070528 RepID=A0A6C0D859_9ZZZZ
MEEEFDSFFNELGANATAGFKFFNAFKVKIDEGTIEFYKDFKGTASFEILKDLRSYMKEEKIRLTEGKKTITLHSVRQRVIFFLTKLHEHSIFSLNDRKYLFFYWQTLDDLMI